MRSPILQLFVLHDLTRAGRAGSHLTSTVEGKKAVSHESTRNVCEKSQN